MNTPKIDMTTLLLSLSSAAVMALGQSEEAPDLELARQNIDLLELLQDKTKGNLSKEEEEVLNRLLFDVRMRFVEAQKKSPGVQS